MDKNFIPTNEFVARGIVQSIERSRFGGRVLKLIVRERRTTLTLNLTLEDGAGRGIGRKDRVIVRGYTRAFSYHNDSQNKDSSVMYFVATDVKQDETELSQRFGIDTGIFYPEHVFRAFVSGKVKTAEKLRDGNWGHLTIETCGGGRDLRPSYVVLRYYLGGRLPVFDYEPGDYICARLSAFTPIKQSKNGNEYIFQNLVVEDIAYLEKKNPKEEQKGNVTALDLGLHKEPGGPSHEELARKEMENIVNTESAGDSGQDIKLADDSALMGDT